MLSLISDWHSCFLATHDPLSASNNVTFFGHLSASSFGLANRAGPTPDRHCELHKPLLHCHMLGVPRLYLKRFQTMPVIFFTISKLQFIVVISVEMISWKTTLCKTDFDSSFELSTSRLLL